MKKSIFLFTILFASFQSFATIRRVNNNPGVVLVTGLVFSSYFTAESAAVNGDTIYIEPSDISYSISVNKRLTIIGPGYLLNKNPNTPFDKRSARISSLNFGNNYAGSKIFGLELRNDEDFYLSISNSNNVEISYCLLNNIDNTTSSMVFTNNIILGNISTTTSASVFSNNIIWGTVNSPSVSNLFKNNIIFGGSTYAGTYFNNIMYENNAVGFQFTQSAKVFNNVCVGCTGTPLNNNFFTTASTTVFAVPEPRTFDDLEDDNFMLATASPAKTKGVGGVDCGVFAGAKPYVLSGIPPFPMITNYIQGPVTGGNLPITISIKRN